MHQQKNRRIGQTRQEFLPRDAYILQLFFLEVQGFPAQRTRQLPHAKKNPSRLLRASRSGEIGAQKAGIIKDSIRIRLEPGIVQEIELFIDDIGGQIGSVPAKIEASISSQFVSNKSPGSIEILIMIIFSIYQYRMIYHRNSFLGLSLYRLNLQSVQRRLYLSFNFNPFIRSLLKGSKSYNYIS